MKKTIGLSARIAVRSRLCTAMTAAMMLAVLAPVRGELTLSEVIENVRQNEQLYETIEVVMDETYDIGDRRAPTHTIAIRKQLWTRYVAQEEWFRLEREGFTENSQRRISRDRIRAFDGETTRLLEQNAVGNISPERLEDSNFIRPHLLLIRHTDHVVPLSVYLSGHEAIQAHPNGRWDPKLTMKVTYEGEEEFNGLKCHVVMVNNWYSGKPNNGREFWLAEERNYLPVRQLAYTYSFSNNIPVGQGIVNELREIAPEVWFPFDVEYTAYNKFKIQREGRQELQWKRRYVVERAELDPQYDRDFFANVEFPDGTAMYEVEKGEIKRSWRQGAPEAPGGPTASRGLQRWWWLLWANGAALAVLAAVLIVRRVLAVKAAATHRQ